MQQGDDCLYLGACLAIRRFDDGTKQSGVLSICFHPSGRFIALAVERQVLLWEWGHKDHKATSSYMGQPHTHSEFQSEPQSDSQSQSECNGHSLLHRRNVRALRFHPSGDVLFVVAPDPIISTPASRLSVSDPLQPKVARLYCVPTLVFLKSKHRRDVPLNEAQTQIERETQTQIEGQGGRGSGAVQTQTGQDDEEEGEEEEEEEEGCVTSLQDYQSLVPQLHCYSDGGFDVSSCGRHLLCIAITYAHPLDVRQGNEGEEEEELVGEKEERGGERNRMKNIQSKSPGGGTRSGEGVRATPSFSLPTFGQGGQGLCTPPSASHQMLRPYMTPAGDIDGNALSRTPAATTTVTEDTTMTGLHSGFGQLGLASQSSPSPSRAGFVPLSSSSSLLAATTPPATSHTTDRGGSVTVSGPGMRGLGFSPPPVVRISTVRSSAAASKAIANKKEKEKEKAFPPRPLRYQRGELSLESLEKAKAKSESRRDYSAGADADVGAVDVKGEAAGAYKFRLAEPNLRVAGGARLCCLEIEDAVTSVLQGQRQRQRQRQNQMQLQTRTEINTGNSKSRILPVGGYSEIPEISEKSEKPRKPVAPEVRSSSSIPISVIRSVTSVRLSPTGDHCVLGYGVRDDNGHVHGHPLPSVACEILRISDKKDKKGKKDKDGGSGHRITDTETETETETEGQKVGSSKSSVSLSPASISVSAPSDTEDTVDGAGVGVGVGETGGRIVSVAAITDPLDDVNTLQTLNLTGTGVFYGTKQGRVKYIHSRTEFPA